MRSGDDSSSMGELEDLGWASGNDSDASSSTFNSADSDVDVAARPRRRHLGHRLESLRLPPEFTLSVNAPVLEWILAGFKTVDGRLSDRAVVKHFTDHVRQYGPQAEPLRVLVTSDITTVVVLIKWRKTYRNYAEMFAAHGAALVRPNGWRIRASSRVHPPSPLTASGSNDFSNENSIKAEACLWTSKVSSRRSALNPRDAPSRRNV